MFLLAKYATQTTIHFPLEIRGLVDLAGQADWTPVTADTRVSKNGAASATTVNLPVCGASPEVQWSLTLTAAELTAAEIVVQIVDAATKAIEDQFLLVYTYGNAAAKIPFDLSITTQNANLTQVLGQPLIINGTGGQKIGT